jgi:diguanylate cyclase (GGDEF)-like protein
MSDNSSGKKPKLPPPPKKEGTLSPTLGSASQLTEAEKAELPEGKSEASENFDKGEQTHTGTLSPFHRDKTASGVTGSERTTITSIAEHTVTRLPGRIVPIIQVSAGAEQGRILSLLQYKHVIIGRGKNCELVVYDPSCSRNHAEIVVRENKTGMVEDLNSTHGTKVNGKRLRGEEMKLSDGDRVQLGDGTVLRFSLIPEEDANVQMSVYMRATRDALTNAFNRHQFDEALNREISYQKRALHGLGIILFDVDHFKRVNDTFGHPAGDEVLREIGNRVPTCIRNEDIFARLGGEEFVVLARSENVEGINILADRIRQAMEKKAVEIEGRTIWFTVSVGSSYTKGQNTITATALFQLADDALYEAKNTGRNRSILKLPPE